MGWEGRAKGRHQGLEGQGAPLSRRPCAARLVVKAALSGLPVASRGTAVDPSLHATPDAGAPNSPPVHHPSRTAWSPEGRCRWRAPRRRSRSACADSSPRPWPSPTIASCALTRHRSLARRAPPPRLGHPPRPLPQGPRARQHPPRAPRPNRRPRPPPPPPRAQPPGQMPPPPHYHLALPRQVRRTVETPCTTRRPGSGWPPPAARWATESGVKHSICLQRSRRTYPGQSNLNCPAAALPPPLSRQWWEP